MSRRYRDAAHIGVAMLDYSDEMGDVVTWLMETDEPVVHDDLFDEGERQYARVAELQVYAAVQTGAGPESDQPEGMYTVRTVDLVIPAVEWMTKGLLDPRNNPEDRLTDRFIFEGVTYDVKQFMIRGRVGKWPVVFGVHGTQIHEDEMTQDLPVE